MGVHGGARALTAVAAALGHGALSGTVEQKEEGASAVSQGTRAEPRGTTRGRGHLCSVETSRQEDRCLRKV